MHPTKQAQPSRLPRCVRESAPARVVRRIIHAPEYGVLYSGIAFWVVAGGLGIGRPLVGILVAHV